MTSSASRRLLVISVVPLVMTLALTGCIASDDNSITAGLDIHIAETHTEARPGTTPAGASVIASSATVQGGYDQANLEKHPVRDKNGKVLSLYRAYIVVDAIELMPCASLAQLPKSLLGYLIGTAQAHTGHGSSPVGDRALDKPNVIDIVTEDGFILPLGDKPVAPDRYCGARVSLVRLASDAYGKPAYAPASNDSPTTVPEAPDMAGLIFAIRADYCQQTDGAGKCTQRIKVDIDDGGAAEPAAVTLAFDQPLEVGATLREAYVVIGIAHGEWLNDVDVTLLHGDPGERRKLLDNIAGSFHINSFGLGELPPNAP